MLNFRKTLSFCFLLWLLLPDLTVEVKAGQAATSYPQTAAGQEQAAQGEIGIYGMVPIYGRDIKDGTYSVEVESSSSMFRIIQAELTVSEGKMEALLTLSGTGYLMLFPGTGTEAARSSEESYLGYEENDQGKYVYRFPVEALNKALPCAAFSKRKEKWYDRNILFDASSLPKEALLFQLPDYELIEKALKAWEKNASQENPTASSGTQIETSASTENSQVPPTPILIDQEDGEYSIEASLSGGSGKSGILSPTLLIVREGRAYARLQWSSPNYDYMIVGNEKYLNLAQEGGNSLFEIPILLMDEEMSVIADTTAMGTPHEVSYRLIFYSDSIGSKGQMPQEAAKRVVIMALIIIVGGGILNHIWKKKNHS